MFQLQVEKAFQNERHNYIKKTIISVILGLLGLALSPYGMAITLGDVKIDVCWALIFPVMAAFAYGPWFGILSGISGGALFPFLVWFNNGLANVYNFIIYIFLFIVLGLLYKEKERGRLH